MQQLPCYFTDTKKVDTAPHTVEPAGPRPAKPRQELEPDKGEQARSRQDSSKPQKGQVHVGYVIHKTSKSHDILQNG